MRITQMAKESAMLTNDLIDIADEMIVSMTNINAQTFEQYKLARKTFEDRIDKIKKHQEDIIQKMDQLAT